MIVVHTGRHAADNHPKRAELGVDELFRALLKPRGKERDGHYFQLVDYGQGARRRKEDVSTIYGYVADLDDGDWSREEIEATFGGHRALVFSTASSGVTCKKNPKGTRRWRVVLPFASGVPRPVFEAIHRHHFAETLAPDLDKRSGEAGQLWYSRRAPNGHHDEAFELAGELFDPAKFLELAKPEAKPKSKANGEDRDPPPAERERAVSALNAISYDGEDRDVWIEIGMAAKAAGVTFEDFDSWSQRQPGYDERHIVQEWKSFRLPEKTGDISAGTLYHRARAAGWTGLPDDPPRWESPPVEVYEADPEPEPEPEPAHEHTAPRYDLTPEELPADFDPRKIPRRRYLIPGRVELGHVHATVSPPAVGKSSIILTRGVAISANRNLLGEEIRQSVPVWIINNEEPAEEVERRIAGIMHRHGIALEELRDGRFFRSCGYGHPYVMVAKNERGEPFYTVNVERMIHFIRKHGIGYVAIGPLISIHRLEENSNDAIEYVATALRYVSSETGAAIDIDHHIRKTGADSESHAGDMNAARGGGAFAAAVRYGFTLARMSTETAERHGIPAEIARRLVRLDSARRNYALPDAEATWFRFDSVDVGNGPEPGAFGDQVGVPVPVKLGEIEREPGDARGEQELLRRERLVALAEWLEHRPEQAATQSETVDAMRQAWGGSIGETAARKFLHLHVLRADVRPYATEVHGPRGRYRVCREHASERAVDYRLKEAPK